MPLTIFSLIVFIIFVSAFFSMVETALFRVSDKFVRVALKTRQKNAVHLKKVKDNLTNVSTTVIIYNNINNIAGSALVGYLISAEYGGFVGALLVFFYTLLIVIFGEILPKNIGLTNSGDIALRVSKFVLFLVNLISPLVFLFNKFLKTPELEKIKEKDILILSEISHQQGEISSNEEHLLRNVLKLNDVEVFQIMTPISVVNFVYSDENVFDVVNRLKSIPNSRLPVYDRDKKDVIGIILKNKLYDEYIAITSQKAKKLNITEFSKSLLSVLSTDKIDKSFANMQKERKHLAAVRDEFGTVLGVVTIEDILEEVFGEIIDETDKYEDLRGIAKKKTHPKS